MLVLGAILKGSNLLPVSVIGIMAIVCIGQVILDVKRHPQSSFFQTLGTDYHIQRQALNQFNL